MERTAAQELSQQGSRRQIIIRYSLEVLQELKQAVSLSILLTILRNLLQQRLCLHLDYSQLIKHRRIEHGIGILLDMGISTCSHLPLPKASDESSPEPIHLDICSRG